MCVNYPLYIIIVWHYIYTFVYHDNHVDHTHTMYVRMCMVHENRLYTSVCLPWQFNYNKSIHCHLPSSSMMVKGTNDPSAVTFNPMSLEEMDNPAWNSSVDSGLLSFTVLMDSGRFVSPRNCRRVLGGR